MSKSRKFKILSLDGGGIRGVFPAYLLAKIEASVKQPIWKYFDLICGTSTGGIISLAIAVGKPVSEVLKMYQEEAATIFPKAPHKIVKAVRCLLGNGGYYPSENLENVLRKFYLVENRSLKMQDARTRLCIPAVDLCMGRTKVYKTPHEVIKPEKETFHSDAELDLWTVARATSAAPFLFPSAKVRQSYSVDGGLWANNPSFVGLTEALRIGFSLEEIQILSVGTGIRESQVLQRHAEKMNLHKWAKDYKFLDTIFSVQSQAVCNQLDHILSKDSYLRINTTYSEKIGIDDIDRIPDLINHSESVVQSDKDTILGRFFTDYAQNPYKSEATYEH